MKNSSVSENDNKSKLNSLYEQIIEHNKKYHQDNNPSISDAEYDELVREAIEIEKKHRSDSVEKTFKTRLLGFFKASKTACLPTM